MTNREIAQALFVTMKTIAMHLTRTYTKLEITGRAQLPAAMGTPDPPHRGPSTPSPRRTS
jgi:DNA-binding NarL/FixJ family response regulator